MSYVNNLVSLFLHCSYMQKRSPEQIGFWGYVTDSLGRALEWHSRGQRFDPAYLHQSKIIRTTSSLSEMGSDFALSSMISIPAANTVSASQNNDMEEIIMKKLLSCEFNIDTARVELRYSDGSMLAIDCDGVEDEYAKTICQRSALDYLVYNAPLEYAELVLNGDVEGYLKK